jgi:predicted alpha/beta-fold hydrolase
MSEMGVSLNFSRLEHKVPSYRPEINSPYTAPMLLRNGHIHTIYPTLFRKVENVDYVREHIVTPDQDYLALDWVRAGSKTVAIITHGLEGDSQRHYVKGMVRALNLAGIDALAWNFRWSSGEPNRQLRFTHNGAIDDLQTVIHHASLRYQRIILIGFSMGGNLSLLYLGKRANSISDSVKGCISFSVPCDLADASLALAKLENILYMKRFLKLLHQKVKTIKMHFPTEIDDHDFCRLKNFKDFDDKYTAPMHGFASAEDYWTQCSSRPWLKHIKVTAVIINSIDDPFLQGGCYPVEECTINPMVTLEITRYGGHVGFVQHGASGCYWSEVRAVNFIKELNGF